MKNLLLSTALYCEYFASKTNFSCYWLVGRDPLNSFHSLCLNPLRSFYISPFSRSVPWCVRYHTRSGAQYAVLPRAWYFNLLELDHYASAGRSWLSWFAFPPASGSLLQVALLLVLQTLVLDYSSLDFLFCLFFFLLFVLRSLLFASLLLVCNVL